MRWKYREVWTRTDSYRHAEARRVKHKQKQIALKLDYVEFVQEEFIQEKM